MIFLVIGLLLAVVSYVTIYIVSENVNRSIGSDLDEFGANMLIIPRNDGLNLNYGGVNITGLTFQNGRLTQDDIILIKSIKNRDNLSIIAPILFNPDKIDGKDVILAGVNFKEESHLKKWWRVNGAYPIKENEVLIGSQVSIVLGLTLNQKINIKKNEFVITGILNETGSQDDGLIFVDIAEAQVLFNKKNELGLIEIAARCYDCPIEEIVKQISAKLPGAKVTAIKQSIESKMTAIHRFEHFSFGISAVILIISLLIVFTNVNASVNERTKEIGIFMAVGFRKWHIIKVILIEVLMASIAAGLLGFFIGVGAAKLITPILSMNKSVSINIDYTLLLIATCISVLAGLLAGIPPALKASRLDPTVAFRSL